MESGTQEDLPRELSLLDSTMINVGSMIGSGIFIVPSTIALYLHSSPLVIAVWVIGGIVSLFGALSVAELGVMFPRAGGIYNYLSEAFGPLWGFLYGWSAFTVIMTAAISAVAVGFAQYLGFFFALSPVSIKIVAIASIVFLTTINCFGTKFGALVQNGFTFVKIASLALLILLGFVLSGGSVNNFTSFSFPEHFPSLISSLGLALVAVLWSYDGWIEITFVAGEVREPQKNIPRSLFISTAIIIALYILINLSFNYVLPLDVMAKSSLVASDAATKFMGNLGASFVAAAVILSMFGANNGFIFTCARIYYAMAKEGMFFKSIAAIHPKYQTPVVSLVTQGVLASLLVLSGTFNQLITYVIFASWIFYAMSCAAVIVLRKKSPNAQRAYKTWGYPYTPIIFILFSLFLVVNTIMEDPVDSIVGAGIILLGVPLFYYWKKRK